MREEGNDVASAKNGCPPPAGCLTLVDILQWRALWQPEQLAYTFLADGETVEEYVSYGELDRRARALAGRLQRDTEVGSCVLLLYPPGLDYIAAFMGCLYAGMIAVPAYPPSSKRSLARIQTIAADAQTRIVLTTSEIAAHVARWAAMLPEIRDLQWLATDNAFDTQENAGQKYQPAPTQVALLQYTSGSTANPKGVMVSHGNLMHNSAMMCACWGHSVNSRGVSWLPMFHDMGLIAGVLQPLYVGFPAVLMSPVAFIQRPLRWLQAISRYKGTTSCAPNFAYELCIRRVTVEERAQLDLSSWAVAVNGAEPVRAETIEHFVEFFKPCGLRSEVICPGYGLAEGTLMVSCTRAEALPRVFAFDKAQFEHHTLVKGAKDQENVQTLVGCGAAASDQRVAIVHPESLRECAPDEIGEIWVAGPSVTLGYWQHQQETEKTFRAFLANGEGPFLRTGDLGCVQDGELCVTGRLKDLIIIRGRNHYPQDIEQLVEQSHPELRPGCGAAFSVEIANQEQLVVIQEVARHIQQPAEICQAIRRSVAEVYELQIYAVVLLRPGSVLKTSSGKIQRRACREAFLQDQLQVVASDIFQEPAPRSPVGVMSAALPSRAAVLALAPAEQQSLLQTFLQAHLGAVLGLAGQQIDLSTPLSALGLDSLRAIELQAWFEERWACMLPFTDLLDGISITELVDVLLSQLRASDAGVTEVISLRSPTDYTVYPLSSAQEQLWVLYQLEPESSFYTIPLALKMTGVLKSDLLLRCLEQLVERHDLLRATFQRQDEQVLQCIHAEPAVAMTVVDLSGLQTRAELPLLLQKAAQKPFKLASDALLRVVLVILGPTEHTLLLAMHHIISDGWSVRLLAWELTRLYAADLQESASPLVPLTLRYADYVRWQRARAESQESMVQLAYWKQQLAHLPVLELPADRARPSVQSYRGAKAQFVVSHQVKQSVLQLAHQEGTTLFTVFLAGFFAFLLRYTGQKDLIIGTVVANRQKAEFQRLIGFLVNTLVLRIQIEPGWSFRTLLRRIHSLCLETYKHQDVPFARLVEELRPERDLGRNPLFQVMCTWQPDVFEHLEMPDLVLENCDLVGTTARFDLSLDFFERETSVLGVVEYATDLFEAGTIQRFIAYFQRLLPEAVALPDQLLMQLAPGSFEIAGQGTAEAHLPDGENAAPTTVHDLFSAQVALFPDAIAVVYGDTCLTYRVLDQRAAQLAGYLHSRGIVAHERVGICLGRSLDLVIALLGVLKVGGTYVPLDPSYPRARLALMIEGVPMGLVLSHSQHRDQLSGTGARITWLDSEWSRMGGQEIDQSELVSQDGGHMLYVIYTSGSTGQPKGAGVWDQGFATLLRWFCSEFAFTASDRFLLISAFSFDLTQKDLFAPLSVGGTLVLAPFEQYDLALIRRFLVEQAITLLNWTPSAFYPLVEDATSTFPLLRTVFLGGEPIAVQRLWPWLERASTEIVNTYGPTECTDVVAYYRLREPERFLATPLPIGSAIWQTRLLALDKRLLIVPPGAIGELALAGMCVGSGYLNDAVLTASRFLPDAFSEVAGQRLYLTGDLVRLRPDGAFEFLGRADHQVKLRGYRIELHEIEAVLTQHMAVRECAALVREDALADPCLVAYVVPHSTDLPRETLLRELRTYLQQKLAPYMIPAFITVLPALPLTSSGKLDRRALPQPDYASDQRNGSASMPRTSIEDVLALLWQTLLGLERVGVHENFFALGGHSLLGAQLVARISSIWQFELPLRTLFESATIAELAQQIEIGLQKRQATPRPPLVAGRRAGDLPLSFAQQRLWLHAQMMPESTAYTTPLPIKFQGRLHVGAVQRSLTEIVRRHEILRTSFALRRGLPVQLIRAPRPVELPVIDLRGLAEGRRALVSEALIEADIQRPFELAAGPLFRTALLRLNDDEHMLLLSIHHIIFDGWSQTILLNELNLLYDAFRGGEQSPLPDLPVQYADFALWQRSWWQGEMRENQLNYWLERLRGWQPLRLPTDYLRPAELSDQGASWFFSLPPQLAATLRTVSRREGVSLFMTLLAGFQVLLGRYSRQRDVLVGTDIANRTAVESESLIGFFVNVLPLRLRWKGTESFHSVLQQVRAEAFGAYAHQDLPFEQLIEALHLERTREQQPLINVLFVWQNLPAVSARAQGVRISPLTMGVNSAKFDLALFLWEEAGQLRGGINYSTDLFRATTIERLARHFVSLLNAIGESTEKSVDDLNMYTYVEQEEKVEQEERFRENQRNKLKVAKRSIIPL